ncbi:MAG: 16S rRNA (uracil(1498)-N(3))-methyltransferase [Clostridiales bacterium]|nr:16S rRNA (uracil(1498)-N(3))-methyltransferase [Clostridiales bacterium]
MERFFAERPNEGETIRITGDDAKHLAKVLRIAVGAPVELCDGCDNVCLGEIIAVSNDEVLAKAGDWQPSGTEPAHFINLLQCLPKAGKMETITQKCVELGVCAIQPVLSERCVALPTRDFEKKRLRYARVAREAAKQSKRGIVPAVLPLCHLKELCFADFDTVLLAYEEERETTLRETLRQGVGKRIALIIGPEGGFAPDEAARLVAKGAVPVSLGPRILRTETAGPAMLAQVLYEVSP